MDPISTAIAEILKAWGPFGAIVVIAVVLICKLYSRIQQLQDQRLNDAKEQLLHFSTLTSEINKAIENQTQATNGLRDVILASQHRSNK